MDRCIPLTLGASMGDAGTGPAGRGGEEVASGLGGLEGSHMGSSADIPVLGIFTMSALLLVGLHVTLVSTVPILLVGLGLVALTAVFLLANDLL